MSVPHVVEVEVVETQRHIPLGGWGVIRLPTDGPEWTNSGLKEPLTREDINPHLPPLYEWFADWSVMSNERTDDEGWQYAFNFHMQYHHKYTLNYHVRKRSWRRVAKLKAGVVNLGIAITDAFAQLLTHQVQDDDADDWDDVAHSEVSAAQFAQESTKRSRGFTSVDGNWQKDSDAKDCNNCRRAFGLLKLRRHHCRNCGLCFCDQCCPEEQLFEGQLAKRVCVPCIAAQRLATENLKSEEKAQVAAEKEAHIRHLEVAVNMQLTEGLEAKLRRSIEEEAETDGDTHAREFKERYRDLCRRLKELEDEEQEKARVSNRSEVLDRWMSNRGPRQGSLKITVVELQNLPPQFQATLYPTCVAIRESTTQQEVMSPAVPESGCPSYNFTAYFGIADDTKPVVISVLDCSHMTPRAVAVVPLDISRDYPNLVRAVTANQVYTESGGVLLRCFNPGMVLLNENVTISVSWTFEAREKTTIAFCDDCGRTEASCRCPPDVVEARRQKAAIEATRREAEIFIAHTRRKELEEEEHRKVAEEDACLQREALAIKAEAMTVASKEGAYHIEQDEAVKLLMLRDSFIHNRSLVAQRQVFRVASKSYMLRCQSLNFDATRCFELSFFLRWRMHAMLRRLKKERSKEESEFREVARRLTQELDAEQKRIKADCARVEAKRQSEEDARKHMEEQREKKSALTFVRVDDTKATAEKKEIMQTAINRKEESKSCCSVM